MVSFRKAWHDYFASHHAILDQQLDNYLRSKCSQDWFTRKHFKPSEEECKEYTDIILKNLLRKPDLHVSQISITDVLYSAHPSPSTWGSGAKSLSQSNHKLGILETEHLYYYAVSKFAILFKTLKTNDYCPTPSSSWSIYVKKKEQEMSRFCFINSHVAHCDTSQCCTIHMTTYSPGYLHMPHIYLKMYIKHPVTNLELPTYCISGWCKSQSPKRMGDQLSPRQPEMNILQEILK